MSSSHFDENKISEEAQRAAFRKFEQIKRDEQIAKALQSGAPLPPPWASEENDVSVSSAPPAPDRQEEKANMSDVHSFTEEDIEKINAHFESLKDRNDGDHLQQLMAAVLDDSVIRLEFVKNPVFIREDGHILDKDDAIDLLNRGAQTPISRKNFEKKDILPCRSIISAMREVLNIINKKIPTTDNLRKDAKVKIAYKTLSSSQLQDIENYYEHKLTLQQKRLFNIICRGENGHILEDPVLMVDGNVYERSLVEPICLPSELTPCYFSRAVLEKINEKIKAAKPKLQADSSGVDAIVSDKLDAKIEAVANSVGAIDLNVKLLPVTRNPIQDEKLSNERERLITDTKTLMVLLGFGESDVPATASAAFFKDQGMKKPAAAPVFKDKAIERLDLINLDMKKVLEAALYSLETLDLTGLEYDKKHSPEYANTETIAGSLFGFKSSVNNAYGKFAKSMSFIAGNVANQPGSHVKELVDEVSNAVKKFNESNYSLTFSSRPEIVHLSSFK